MSRAVVLAAVRTPVGRYGGALSGVRPDDLAATVIAQVEAHYRVKLPLNLFYTAPTVEEHARYVEALLAPPPQPPSPDELDRLLTMIEALSDEEAAGYLRSLDAAPQGDEL